jgi:methylamine dehydrogenase heavy chain
MLPGRPPLTLPCLLLALGAPALAAPPLPAEHLDVTLLPPSSPHWVYVLDEALNNYLDARVHPFDGDSYRRLGQIDAGYTPGFAISPDGKTSAVGTTYFSRGSHGARTDVVEFTDNRTLQITHEVVLPPKRAQTLPTEFSVAYSADQRFLYVANLTPATSLTVVDVANSTALGEIDTDGCVLAIPSGAHHVSSLCENGRLLTVSIGNDGREVARAVSNPFFNADRDPIFVQGVPLPDGVLFLSFLGDLYEVRFADGKPSFAAPWPLVAAKDRGKWRPGGQQVMAFHRRSGRIYLPMHRGGEGTHKAGGSEIWVVDKATHQRVSRWPVPAGLDPVLAVQVSQDEHPLLFALTEKSDLLVMDAASGTLKHVEKQMGQSAWYLYNP